MQYAPGISRTYCEPCAEGELNDGIKEEIEKQGLHLLGVIPQDDTVYEYDCEGRPTASLPEDNPVKVALKEIIKNLNL